MQKFIRDNVIAWNKEQAKLATNERDFMRFHANISKLTNG